MRGGGVPGATLAVDLPDGTTLHEVTAWNATSAGASGALISTPADVNRFFAALLNGRLLRPAELSAMRSTVPADPARMWPGAQSGLGVYKTALQGCKGEWWGHRGSFFGYRTISATTPDGRQATIALNQHPTPSLGAAQELITTTLCDL
ncbi:serine hydrolase [Sinosporangium siamense]|uniref:Beta-lactamase-related domain-containing protein n=1 Tax=Sinosporangium siamense TaxID=1367973 RepID=A0A919VB18_9ACTN|nr:serine hydrolase [Sinosporangium siamense]GII96017.1 hypothetical protein Ssi02_62480 [Sinosporangium siamense]